MMHNVNQTALITAVAAELKKQHVVVPPEWAAFAKTGSHRERPPADQDWWYTRAASILRTVYLFGPIGTEKLRVRYGGRQNRGVKPDRFAKAGGNHLRKILQQLEAAQLLKQEQKGGHKGRVITPLGRKLIHAIAGVVQQSAPKPKAAAKPAEAPKAAPSSTPAKTETPTEKPVADSPKPEAAPKEKGASAPAEKTEPKEAGTEKKTEIPVEKATETPEEKKEPEAKPTPETPKAETEKVKE